MSMNSRPVSFAILSGALMIVGSSMAFANPDQTNPRESGVAPACASTSTTNCETTAQSASVTSDPTTSTAAANDSIVESDHDARRDRNHMHRH